MTITHDRASEPAGDQARGPLRQLWAELGLECQLECVHCYAAAGPGKGFGTLTADDWERVIGQAAALGCRHVTFIGGEPILYPQLARLVHAAASAGMHAEVYSNLVHVRPVLWHLLETPGVSVATSWYTDDRGQHKAITGRDTWRQTRANILETLRRGIPLRVGMIDGIIPGQRTREGEQHLRDAGVSDIGTDYLREFGRGTIPDPSQACGNCGHGRAAVLPDGTVTPCPMTRWMSAGSVREAGLGDIMASVTSLAATAIPARARKCNPETDCPPNWTDCKPDGTCGPTRATRAACNPDDCRPDVYCEPLRGSEACKPFGK